MVDPFFEHLRASADGVIEIKSPTTQEDLLERRRGPCYAVALEGGVGSCYRSRPVPLGPR